MLRKTISVLALASLSSVAVAKDGGGSFEMYEGYFFSASNITLKKPLEGNATLKAEFPLTDDTKSQVKQFYLVIDLDKGYKSDKPLSELVVNNSVSLHNETGNRVTFKYVNNPEEKLEDIASAMITQLNEDFGNNKVDVIENTVVNKDSIDVLTLGVKIDRDNTVEIIFVNYYKGESDLSGVINSKSVTKVDFNANVYKELKENTKAMSKVQTYGKPEKK